MLALSRDFYVDYFRQQTTLCNICDKLDFPSLFFRDGKDWGSQLAVAPLSEYAIYLGTLSSVESRASLCGFCQLVCNFRVQKVRSNVHPLAQDADVFITGYNIHSFASRRNDFSDPLLGPGIYVLIVQLGDRAPMLSTEYSGATSERNSIQLLEHPRLTASRVIPDCANVELLKGYLESCTCETGLGRRPTRKRLSAVFHTLSIDSEFESLRLVDVKKRKVVKRDTTARYAALSYVWGGLPTERTFLLSVKDVGLASGLSNFKEVNLPKSLPWTIEDALTLTDKLGLKYLWVDSLCIVQDDEKQKLEQIRNMHKIFRYAEVCIVAASGDNVHAGIAGVRPSMRLQVQHPKKVKDMTLGFSTHSDADFVGNSVWASRGWTLQEIMLAKKALIFGQAEASFQCAEFCRRESRGKLQYQGFRDSLQVDIKTTNHPLHAYVTIVQRFTKRTLSDKRDILNAFAGFCHALNHLFPGSFRYGIPLGTDFAMSLLWLPIVRSFKRRVIEGQDRRPMYPSWSWAGWEGPVSHSLLDGSMVAIASGTQSCISFSARPESADMIDSLYQVDPTNESPLLDFELAPGLIAIRAAKIPFKLEEIDAELTTGPDLRHRTMQILNEADEPVGSCIIEEEDRDGDGVDFILIGTGPTKLMGHEVGDLMTTTWGRENLWGYLLLIKTVEGLSYRVGIGQVNTEAIDAAIPEHMEIVLA